MMVGPWTHGGRSYDVYWSEMLRWYDHWLKGIDNGVMDEPPIHYFVMRGNNTVPERDGRRVSEDQERADDPASWTAAETWPPPGITSMSYYLTAGPSGTVSSVNDGGLSVAGPPAAEGRDAYTVDYTCTTGEFNRWRNGYGATRSDPEGTTFFDERTPEDRKALTYTSPALPADLTLVGYPVVHLWVSSTRSDGDFFAYLEEVDADGRSHYVSEGALRASHRALGTAPFDNFGLPYHLSVPTALVAMPGADEPVELVFDLEGTAIVMDHGHRIRVTVTGADAANYQLDPDPSAGAPTVAVHRGPEHPSRIELPVYSAD